MIETEAWVLPRGPRMRRGEEVPGTLERKVIPVREPGPGEVLAEPLYGCWEGNMTHALRRDPVDICRLRRDQEMVLGNSGVVRIAQTGPGVESVASGDHCLLLPRGQVDRYGFIQTVLGYDEPGSPGMLARRINLRENQVTRLPAATRHPLERWAGLSIRYATAWNNWQVALGCLRSLVSAEELPAPHVWGWGGGTTFAEIDLARRSGCRVAMVCSSEHRAELLRRHHITPVDRREFPDIGLGAAAAHERSVRARYRRSEGAFLRRVDEVTGGEGVSIFMENLGGPLLPATLRALAQPGVLTTVGWKEGPEVSFYRPAECIGRHVHVHTHAMRIDQVDGYIAYAEREGWLPPEEGADIYPFEEIPRLAEDFAAGRVDTYFPLYQVNEP